MKEKVEKIKKQQDALEEKAKLLEKKDDELDSKEKKMVELKSGDK